MRRLIVASVMVGAGLLLTACQPMQTAPSVVPGVQAPSPGITAPPLQAQNILWGD